MSKTPKPQQAQIIEYTLDWNGNTSMSTHELQPDADCIYVTGQNMHSLARVTYGGDITYHSLPKGSGPHGILLDGEGRLWVSLEFHGKVVRLDKELNIVQEIDVRLPLGDGRYLNPAPHGIGLDADGQTIWFTGKRTSTVGKINPDGSVEHYQLQTLAAMPIFLSSGPDGNIWGTELLGSTILTASKEGTVSEYAIPTSGSRPIGIIPDPSEAFMWFTEEAGNKVGRIDMDGNITEYHIPSVQKNDILGSLCFDPQGNLWVQCYVDFNNPTPEGNDYIIKIDASIRRATAGEIAGIPIVWNKVPSRNTMLHRIRMGADGNMWFTEMATNKLAKIVL